MKDIKKIFNIKASNKSQYSFKELIMISLTFSFICCLLTSIIIYSVCTNKFSSDQARDDILSTYNKIKDSYYEDVDSNEVADAAIDGMLSYLNEKYSVYMNSEDTDSLQDKLKGNYEGIGIGFIQDKEGNRVIREIYANTPAENSGLKEEDILIEVNGIKITEDISNDDIKELIADKNEVTLVILRDDLEHTFIINKDVIDYPVVTSKTFEKDDKLIGYIYLSTFTDSSEKQVRSSLSNLESKGIDSLIIDLRGNTGGYLNSAREIASMFLKEGDVIFSLENKKKIEKVYDTTKERRSYDIVILIDQISASASELLAASLHESYGAILVGHTSYGKGKVQEMSTLSDDTMIKFTTAKWFTPSGDSIDTIGLTPDISVDLTAEYAKNPIDDNDEQLQMGLYVLANK